MKTLHKKPKPTLRKLFTLVFLLAWLPLFATGQNAWERSIYLQAGANQLNPVYLKSLMDGHFKNVPCLSIDLGYKVNRRLGPWIIGTGLGVIQNCEKRYFNNLEYYYKVNTTKAYLSIPLRIGIMKKNNYLTIGTSFDYFLFQYERNKSSFRTSHYFTPWFMAFVDSIIPFSFHLEAELGRKFCIREEHTLSVSLNFKMFEVISFYGRNEIWENYVFKKYYNPISLSVSVSYYLKNKEKTVRE